MTLSGLTGSPARYCLHVPAKSRGLCFTRISFLGNVKSRKLTCLQRNDWASSIQRCSVRKAPMSCRAMNAMFGDSTNDSAIFPRINVGDPYKRLGISREASQEEVQAARNFLLKRYGGHSPSSHKQVAVSLMATIYFIHDRLKSKWRALFYGVGAFLFSWLFGTFLMVSVIPPILKGPRSLEVTTSLITYVLLWVSSTYLE
ncbi:hypothetical protein Vadar_027979 [Vaccinium darrowii]|uniref:Uncharacterized protein n=1 Tax=Vaccinium darrowii TaxID=229202 RepID=A0ACB7X4H9_9ERIC|nr:hypothetical protein Vadar_027979 [Vaccinium darrowii]